MAACGYCLSRRAFVLGTLGAAVAAGTAGAQAPELASEEIARGHLEYADAIGGPAELITLKLTFPPGTVIPWHLHPGTVEGIITAGTLTMYLADGCTASYGPGAAVIVPAGAVHEEHNEDAVPLEVISTFLQPAGAPLRVPMSAPDAAACAPG
jgi:quercetin dioxygenase-like cupin family protein